MSPTAIPGNLLLKNGMVITGEQKNNWTPAEITTALWLDAADASTITESGGAVSQWDDKSGNGRNATQSTPSNQPIFSATGLNNKQSINFDGDGDNLILPTGFLNGSPSISVAFVMLGPLQDNDAIFGPSTSNSTGLEMVYANVASYPTLLRVNGTNKITTGLWSTNSQPSISTIQANSSLTSGWLNGSAVNAVDSTGISALNFNGVYSLGTYANNVNSTNNSGLTVSANMNMSEFVISESVWSTADRQKIEGYLAHKWGLTANLPADHPYKTAIPVP